MKVVNYQQTGMLHKKENINKDLQSPGSNTDSYVMPLFGKPLYKGSSNRLYYTNTSSNIKIPIKNKNKDCSDRGCPEIYDNDSITIDELIVNLMLKFISLINQDIYRMYINIIV